MNKAAGSPDSKQEMLRFLFVLWRRWGILCLVIGITFAAVGSFFAISKFEKSYQAKLFFRIIHNLEWTELAKGLGDKLDSKSVLSMIESEVIAERVALDETVAKARELRESINKAAGLRQMVDVSSEGGKELFSIKSTAKDPQFAARVAELFWKEFDDEQEHFKIRQSNILLEKLTQEISTATDKLKNLETEIQRLNERITNSEIEHVQGENGLIFVRLSALQEDRRDKEAEIATTKRDLRRHQEDPVDYSYTDEDLEIEVDTLPTVVDARRRLEGLDLELTKLAQKKGESHPDYENLVRVRYSAERDLLLARKNGKEKLEASKRREADKENELKLANLERRLEELEFDRTEIDNRISEEHAKVQAFKNLNFDLQLKEEDRDVARSELMAFKQRERQIRLKQIAPYSVARIYISDENETVAIPQTPVEEYPTKMLVMICLLSLVAPFALFALWELRVRRVASPDQVEVNANLIGEIADLPARYGQAYRRKQQSQVFEESFNGVSTFLRTRSSEEKMASLAITSAVSNEGKTTFASQLAVSLARTSSQAVLIIDCDLRNPSVHKLFELDLDNGVVDVLKGELEWQDAVSPTYVDNLEVIPAGYLRGNPHRLLGEGRIAELLEQVEQKYSYVILDTPPVLAASESLIVARAADAALMCVMRDVSRIDVVRRAYDRLSKSAKVLGYIFSGVPQTEYAQRYGGYDYARSHKSRASNSLRWPSLGN